MAICFAKKGVDNKESWLLAEGHLPEQSSNVLTAGWAHLSDRTKGIWLYVFCRELLHVVPSSQVKRTSGQILFLS